MRQLNYFTVMFKLKNYKLSEMKKEIQYTKKQHKLSE